ARPAANCSAQAKAVSCSSSRSLVSTTPSAKPPADNPPCTSGSTPPAPRPSSRNAEPRSERNLLFRMRVFLLNPQLSSVGGHYLSHDAQLVRDLQRRDTSVEIYGKKKCEISTCCGIQVAPTFSHDIFQEACSDALVWPVENFNNVNQAFLA